MPPFLELVALLSWRLCEPIPTEFSILILLFLHQKVTRRCANSQRDSSKPLRSFPQRRLSMSSQPLHHILSRLGHPQRLPSAGGLHKRQRANFPTIAPDRAVTGPRVDFDQSDWPNQILFKGVSTNRAKKNVSHFPSRTAPKKRPDEAFFSASRRLSFSNAARFSVLSHPRSFSSSIARPRSLSSPCRSPTLQISPSRPTM